MLITGVVVVGAEGVLVLGIDVENQVAIRGDDLDILCKVGKICCRGVPLHLVVNFDQGCISSPRSGVGV